MILSLQLAWIMSGFIQDFYIPMLPVINGPLEVNFHVNLNLELVSKRWFSLNVNLIFSFTFPAFAELLDNSLDEVWRFHMPLIPFHEGPSWIHPCFSIFVFSPFNCWLLWFNQVCNGATYVLVDVLINKRDKNKMLLVEGM